MKLYFRPRSRSTRPRWLLEEIGVPYDLVRIAPSEPEGHPALEDGELTFFEASSLCLIHLADRFPEAHLAPPPGSPDRGRYFQAMSFAEGTVEPLVMELYGLTQRSGEPTTDLQEKSLRGRLDEALGVVAAALAGRSHLAGDRFTAADLLMVAILHLAHTLHLLDGHPELEKYVLEHTKRPACRQAIS